MMPNAVVRRRVLALCASVILLPGSLHSATAQDGQTSGVQAVARQWLVAADALDGSTTWNMAGARFRGAITLDRWTSALRMVREPLGPVVQRTSTATAFEKHFPNVPAGEYALLQYRTAFDKNADGHETLTLEHEADGNWRVIGYFIR